MTWREGANATLASRFADVRVRPAHRDRNWTSPRPEERCLIEWPVGEPEPTKYCLSASLAATLRRALKQELAVIPWEMFRPKLLVALTAQNLRTPAAEHRSAAGCKPPDEVVIFKAPHA